MSSTPALYDELCQRLHETAVLGSCSALLSWDEQTGMPAGGSAHRAEQVGLIAGLIHERATHPRVGEILDQLAGAADLGEVESIPFANVREARRTYDRAKKLPRRLVEELSRTTSLAQQSWIKARRDNDFPSFLPWLEKMIALKREEAEAVGYGDGHPYDALLDEYEPEATAVSIQAVFGALRPRLVDLIARIQNSSTKLSTEIVDRHYPKAAQRVFADAAARSIGFSYDRGRLDESAHPFCSGIGPGDVRLTTRFMDHHFNSAFFGVLHEAGHGIYEQGLPDDQFGLGCGTACSLGIHESQSRLWENFVGRSPAFWNYFYPNAKQAFPSSLKDVPQADFYKAINVVEPSFIRVEADEATYNLHIMLRFELELKLITGELPPRDLPAVWNSTFQRDFALTPPNDAQGCLQDIHWSAGLFGYFPTYALGNIYAGMLFEAAGKDLGDLAPSFSKGEFLPLKTWLGEKIHQHGRRFSAAELMKKATGLELTHEPLMRHLEGKYSALYGL